MPKQNPYLIENKKIEIVQEIEKYEIKKSPLSPAARSKVISKSGSDYLSKNRDDYGPGSNQSSYSDNSEGTRVERQYGKTALSAITSVVPPPAQIVTGVLTTAVSEIGYACSSDSDTKDSWKYASELGQGMAVGGFIGQQMEGAYNATQVSSRPGSLISQLLREGKTLHEIYELRGGWDRLHLDFHQFHRTNGVEYDSRCDVCKR